MKGLDDIGPPPAADELEISLFGPGFGECSVVHVGQGRWITIDSCLTDERKEPAALAYFNALGIDPAVAVSHVIISHPDNDHIGGISQLLDAAKSAELVVSSAYTDRDVMAWTQLYAQADPSAFGRPTSELIKCFTIAKERGRIPIFAGQDRLLAHDVGFAIHALAPSDRKLHLLMQKLVKPKKSEDKMKPVGLAPNPASVVIHLETPHCIAIFGGDLEETPGLGWSDIMVSSQVFKKSAAPLIFKVPHHGSPNADLPALWAHFGKSVIAIMSNFNSGREPRPAPDDVTRILGYTDAAFVCSSRRGGAPKKDAEVEKHLKLIGIKRRMRFNRDGQIRIRIKPQLSAEVELFGAATELAKLYAA